MGVGEIHQKILSLTSPDLFSYTVVYLYKADSKYCSTKSQLKSR